MDNIIESGYSESSPITKRDVQIVWLNGTRSLKHH